jgi:hypothetical protein
MDWISLLTGSMSSARFRATPGYMYSLKPDKAWPRVEGVSRLLYSGSGSAHLTVMDVGWISRYVGATVAGRGRSAAMMLSTGLGLDTPLAFTARTYTR